MLVVCFLGLGMGCWDCRKPFALRDLLVPLGVLVALLAVPPTRAAGRRDQHNARRVRRLRHLVPAARDGWLEYAAPRLGLVLTFVLMVLLWEIFVPVGRLLGRLMNDHPNTIWAYSVNVAGSLVGIWLFVLASACTCRRSAWFAVFAVGRAPVRRHRRKVEARATSALLAAIRRAWRRWRGYEPGSGRRAGRRTRSSRSATEPGSRTTVDWMRWLLGERAGSYRERGRRSSR